MQLLNKTIYCTWIYFLTIVLIADARADTFEDENLALLDVVFSRQIIGDGLDAYIDEDRLFIPLSDLVRLLEVSVIVDDFGAAGVITKDDGTFEVKKNEDGNWVAILNGKVESISSEDIKVNEGYIYISSLLAESWFGTSFELDFNDSYLFLTTTKLLPFQQRLMRQQRQIGSQYDVGAPDNPAIKLPYAMAEIPSIDARVNYLSRRHDDDEIEDFRSVYYAARTYGDLLGMSAQTFWTGNRNDGIKGASLSFDRYDSSRSMGGWLGLSQVSFGDLSHPALPLAPGSYGRGLIVGNDVVSGDSSRSIRDIEGDYYPNWEVELYLNQTLVGYQTIGEDGHYKFTDVILFQGRNEFVLKFYGPSGQVEEKTEYINVGANPGDGSNLFYTFSVSQPDRKVYEIGDDKLRAESADDVYQATLLTRYSFGRAFGLQAGIQETRGEIYRDETNSTGTDIDDILSQKEEPEGEVANQYYSLEMHTGFDAHTFSITAAKQNNRDVSYLYRLGGNIGRTVYRIDFNQYGAFTDTLATNPVNNLYGLSLTQRFKRGAAVLRMNRLENEKRYSDEYRLGVSGSVSRVNWSNSLLYENTVYADVSHQPDVGEASEDAESLSGAFIVSTSLSSFIARFTTSYDVIPNNQLSKVNLSTSYRLYPKAKLNFDFSHSLNTNNNRYRLGLNWQLNEFHITPSVLYSSDGQWQGQVQLSTSLGKRTGRLGSYYDMASDPSMSKGSVRARLFEDQNFDGQYQIGEPLLSGGEIKAVHARRRGKSNSAGVAWLDAVQSWKLTDIEVDSNTIDAGAMTLSRDPFSLVARPGKVVEIDLPFNRVGALDGTVFDSIDGILTPAWGISVVINDENGEVVDKQVTDTDGYFDFSKLPPGSYTLNVEDVDLISVSPETATIKPSGGYVSGVEITIDRVFADELDDEMAPLINDSGSEVKPDSPQDVKEGGVKDDSSDTTKNLPISEFGVPAPPLEKVSVEVEYSEEKEQAPEFTMEKSSSNRAAAVALELWSLQGGSFSSDDIAIQFSEKLKNAQFETKIVPVTVGGKQYYRVYAIGFETRSIAENAKKAFDSQFNVRSLIVKQ